MTAQVKGNTGEIGFQFRNELTPGDSAGANAMNHVERRSCAFDGVGDIN